MALEKTSHDSSGRSSGKNENAAQAKIGDYLVHHSLVDDLIARSRTHGNHSKRVRAIAVQIGLSMMLTHQELINLSLGALLHDIGKLRVRLVLLKTKAKIDRQSRAWAHMQEHSDMGAEIVRANGLNEDIAICVRHHHEYFDGSGYPLGLVGADIPLLARITAIADAYDTMTSMREYQTPRDVHDAVEELERCAGTQFDPEIVCVFTELLRERHNLKDGVDCDERVQLAS